MLKITAKMLWIHFFVAPPLSDSVAFSKVTMVDGSRASDSKGAHG